MARLGWLLALGAAFVDALALGPGTATTGYMGRRGDPLRCFQVTSPVLTPEGLHVDDQIVSHTPRTWPSCKLELVRHSFANSSGKPFSIKYKPPSWCPFDRVVLNLTVVSEGRQYDRLAIFWLGDTEIWRTSTAEPKASPGIVWTAWKDVSNLRALWRHEHMLVVDLGNTVSAENTGSFDVTLTATFIDEWLPGPFATPADAVIPVSARRSDQRLGSAFVFPDDRPQNVLTLPRNIQRAVVSVAATAQGDDEFWWSNVPESYAAAPFANVTLPGSGCFREIRLWIDGHLTGLAWPAPVVFSGGIAPSLHRPLVGIEAFDMREHEMDVTPWLGLLCNGRNHNFSLEVVTQNGARSPRYWILSAKIFLWLEPSGAVTTGSRPEVKLMKPQYSPSINSSARFIKYRQTLLRSLDIRSSIKRNNETSSVGWNQRFTLRSSGAVIKRGKMQRVKSVYHSEDRAIEDLYTYYYGAHTYPLSTLYEFRRPTARSTLVLEANLTQGFKRVVTGLTAFPSGVEPFLYRMNERVSGVEVDTTRSGHGIFLQDSPEGGFAGGYSSMHQSYRLAARDFVQIDSPESDPNPLLYSRMVAAVNGTVTRDHQHVYRADVRVPDIQVAPRPARVNRRNQFAPVLAVGGPVSYHFSAKRLGLDPSSRILHFPVDDSVTILAGNATGPEQPRKTKDEEGEWIDDAVDSTAGEVVWDDPPLGVEDTGDKGVVGNWDPGEDRDGQTPSEAVGNKWI